MKTPDHFALYQRPGSGAYVRPPVSLFFTQARGGVTTRSRTARQTSRGSTPKPPAADGGESPVDHPGCQGLSTLGAYRAGCGMSPRAVGLSALSLDPRQADNEPVLRIVRCPNCAARLR